MAETTTNGEGLAQRFMTRKHTILVVDDARHNRTALREILNDNYIVLEAENGQNALAVLEEKYQAVTVIILDLTVTLRNFSQRCKISEYTCDRDVERHQ